MGGNELRVRLEFFWVIGGVVVFVYIKKGRGKKRKEGRKRKWELLSFCGRMSWFLSR